MAARAAPLRPNAGELGLDARHRLAVVRPEAAALEQHAPDRGEQRRGNARQGDQQIGLADSRPDDHASPQNTRHMKLL